MPHASDKDFEKPDNLNIELDCEKFKKDENGEASKLEEDPEF